MDEHGFRAVKKTFKPKVMPKQVVIGSTEHEVQEVVKSVSKETNSVMLGIGDPEASNVEQPANSDSYVDTLNANSFAALNFATEPESDVILEAPSGNIALGADPIHDHD